MELFKGVSISAVLYAICGLILVICFVQKNSNFFDVRAIFVHHSKVFKNSPLQCFTIFIMPLILALSTTLIKLINEDIVININIVLSILISMFFAMLSILCSFNRKHEDACYNQLLRETFNAIVFECILCILLLLISFIQLFINDFQNSIYLFIISTLIYYLVMVIILNIFVIVKRLKVLFDNKNDQ
jgi:hypothetical protein